MFKRLEAINERPEPFSRYTADALWNDPYTSEKMLAFHLDEHVDISSRNAAFIAESVAWIASKFKLGKHSKIIDFGCGPGLYTTPLARLGAQVTGIDFSSRSIRYAEKIAALEDLPITYYNQNYLEFQTEERFDLILMIMCDFCALSPLQRKTLLNAFHTLLAPNGAILLDVYSLAAFDHRAEAALYEENLLNSFWAPARYFGFLNTFKYPQEKVVLDKYTIIEPEHTRTVYNWLQYLDADSLKSAFQESGFAVQALYGNVAGAPCDPKAHEFAALAVKS